MTLMRLSGIPRFLFCIVLGITLASTAAAVEPEPAQDFAIHLSPPLAAGQRYLASGTLQLDQEITPEQGPGTGEKHFLAHFEIAVRANEVTPRGNLRQAVLTIRKLEQQSGGSTIVLLPPGDEVTARRVGGKLVFEKSGHDLGEELSTVFHLVTEGRRDEKPTDDQAFGTQARRRVGESWPVNAAAVADLLSEAFVIDPKDVVGTTTLTGQGQMQGKPSVELRTQVEIRKGSRVAGLPTGGDLELVLTDTRVLPEDASFFAHREDASIDMSLHLSSKNEAGAPREIRLHLLLNSHCELSPLP